MLTPEERDLLTDQQDRLIDLFVQHDEAIREEDWARARDLESQIDEVQSEADELRHGAGNNDPAVWLVGSAKRNPAPGPAPAAIVGG